MTSAIADSNSQLKGSKEKLLTQEQDEVSDNTEEIDLIGKQENVPFKPRIAWSNVIWYVILHVSALYGMYLAFTGQSNPLAFIYMIIASLTSGMGITLGCHRLWSHRSYKARLPVRLFLIVAQAVTGQHCLWVWVRDHRLHHKFSDTDADPHNAKRGFFFCHMGWLMMQKHPQVIAKGKLIDMSDIEADPWIMMQKKYYKSCFAIFAVIIPFLILYYIFNESVWNIIFINGALSYALQLNAVWCVNSVAHMFGYRPYDKSILPVECAPLSFVVAGEGWHNYHHAFPSDCHASEYGKHFNLSSRILEILERLEMVYDLNVVSKETVVNRILKVGDGSHPIYGHKNIFSKNNDRHASEEKMK